MRGEGRSILIGLAFMIALNIALALATLRLLGMI